MLDTALHWLIAGARELLGLVFVVGWQAGQSARPTDRQVVDESKRWSFTLFGYSFF